MDLFNEEKTTNLLPRDGIVIYYGRVLKSGQAGNYFDKLMHTIKWKHDEVVILGKHIITKREVAWYGDAGYSYTYSGATKEALTWTKELRELKKLAEDISGATFNSCLLNLYHNGDEGMGWHSDDEKTLEKNSAIASFSLGVERKFSLKHKNTKQAVSVLLENGSLLLMKGETQSHWLHSLPKSVKVNQPRINLTFRTMLARD
jgi:alkylated DNA repair dioxygenase AlkB